MAIIKTFRYPVNFVAMFEDPIPGSNFIYFQADAYDKNTLNGVFDYGLIYSTNGQLGTSNTFGRSKIDQFAGDGLGGALILNGECTHVRHRIFNTLNDFRNNLDFAPFASMEPGRPAVSSAYYTDGNSNIVIGSFNYSDPTPASNSYSSNYVIPYFTKLNTNSVNLATSNSLNATGNYIFAWNAATYGTAGFPIYRNPATNNLVWITAPGLGQNNTGAQGWVPSTINGASLAPLFVVTPAQQGAGPGVGNNNAQHLGVSIRDGFSLNFQNKVDQDFVQNIIKYNDGNNTAVSVFNPTVVPFPSGLGQTGTYYVSTNSNLTLPPGTIMSAISSATFLGGLVGSVLTVQSITSGQVRIGQMIQGSGVIPTTTITSVISLTSEDGVGTYNVSVGGGNSPPGTTMGAIVTATITGFIQPNFWQPGGNRFNQLTVTAHTAVTPGSRLVPGMQLGNVGITTATTIVALTTSTRGWNTSTNRGMDRITNPGGGAQHGGPTPRFASRTFPCPTAPTQVRGFYVPYTDLTGNYHPLYFQWTTATDTFSRSANVTVNYATGTSFESYWRWDSFSASPINAQFGMQKVLFNETFTSDTGTRYLMLMQLHGAGGVYDSTSTLRTCMVYSVDPVDPLVLYYSSSFVIPQTPKNIVWLNNARTQFAVIAHTATYVYTLRGDTFQLTATFPYQFNAVGRDNYNRVWAHDTGPVGWGRIHLLSGVPSNVTVIANTTTYSYTGVNTTSTFAVDAWDLGANRLASVVNLSVSGSNLALLNTSGQYVSSLTVVTSTSSSTIVTGQIIGSGYSNISASVTI